MKLYDKPFSCIDVNPASGLVTLYGLQLFYIGYVLFGPEKSCLSITFERF